MTDLPQAMVLVFDPRLTHSVWQDYVGRHRTVAGLERALRAGVRRGEWVAWRLIRVEREIWGNDKVTVRQRELIQ